jgi:glycosylphosphatidylinositol transamidase (GPIT) subunit GPI8
MDNEIGVAVIDRFTYYNLEFLEKIYMQSKATLKDLFGTYDPAQIHSTPGVRSDFFRRHLDKVCYIVVIITSIFDYKIRPLSNIFDKSTGPGDRLFWKRTEC